MARKFTNAGDNLNKTTYPIPFNEGTLLIWGRPTFVFADGQSHTLWMIEAAGPKIFGWQKYSDNKIYIGWYDSGNDDRAVKFVEDYLKDGWNCFIFCWIRNESSVCRVINTLAQWETGELNADAVWNTAGSTLFIGNNTANNSPWIGDIGQVCIWDICLAKHVVGVGWDPQVLDYLGSGGNPLRVHPGHIVDYWPVWGEASERSMAGQGRTLTVSGPTVALGNPPVMAPSIWMPTMEKEAPAPPVITAGNPVYYKHRGHQILVK